MDPQYPDGCPIRDCSTALAKIGHGGKTQPFCPTHGIRLHSDTFVYWNGKERENEARLRNFRVRPDFAREIALGSVEKAESHRLGHEMSEDALSWNVFVGLAEAGKLRHAVRFLTGRSVDAEPDLYLWGELIDVKGGRRTRFKPLDTVRERLERRIDRFKTEPDVMLVLDRQLLVCIEAKFGSGNPLAYEGPVKLGQKPVNRAGLLRCYLDQATEKTKAIIDRDAIREPFHSQLFRNVVFACEMADGCTWHVVNLVSRTQWNCQKDSNKYSFVDPKEQVRAYLRDDYRQCFSFATWEELHAALIKPDSDLSSLDVYLRSKSAHYRRAFELD